MKFVQCFTPHTIQKRKQSQGVINDLDNVDIIPSNVNSSASSNPERTWYGYQDPGESVDVTIDQGNLRIRHHKNQVIQKRILVDLGLLKSGKVELRSTIDQGNLRQLLVIYCKKLTLIVRNLFSAGMRILQGTETDSR